MCPGLSPFVEALRLPAFVCTNCGFWQRYFEHPASCPMCLDARHVVPREGWRFLDEAAAADHVVLMDGRVVASGPPAQVLTAANLDAVYGRGALHAPLLVHLDDPADCPPERG